MEQRLKKFKHSACIVTCAFPLILIAASTCANAQAASNAAETWFFKTPSHVSNADSLKGRAESGKAEDQLRYAKYLFDTDQKPIAVVWLTEANNQGNVEAQYLLGLLYETGDGVAQDFDQSRYFFGKAADQDYPPAQYKLGKMLINAEFDDPDESVKSDEDLRKQTMQGIALLRKSADSGYAPAQYEMGLLFLNGGPTGKQPDQAFSYFKRAADQGLAAACYVTATSYASGNGTPKDIASARRYLTKTIELDGRDTDYGRDAESMLKKLGETQN